MCICTHVNHILIIPSLLIGLFCNCRWITIITITCSHHLMSNRKFFIEKYKIPWILLIYEYRFELEDFKYNHVNMTAFRIVDGDNIKVKTILREMENLPEIGYKILNRTQVIWFMNDFVMRALRKRNIGFLYSVANYTIRNLSQLEYSNLYLNSSF